MAHVTNGIGGELREARVQRGLSLEDVSYETRIRTRYLEALEDERFEDLPGEAYAKGFLRTYADFLDLDGGRMLVRYRDRFPRRAEPAVAPRPQPPYEPRRLLVPALVATAAVLLAAGALVAWQLDGDGGDEARAPATTAAATTTAAQPEAPTPQPARPTTPPAALALSTAAPCWLEVRLGGPNGRLLWVGTLQPGRRLRLGLGRRIWFRAGNPAALRPRIGGKLRPLPSESASFLVTPAGIRTG